jgi:hypothetical protein
MHINFKCVKNIVRLINIHTLIISKTHIFELVVQFFLYTVAMIYIYIYIYIHLLKKE